jgi:hypothetical protein
MDRAQQFIKDSIHEDMDIFLKDYFIVNPRTAPLEPLPQKAK